jgi:branched-chain amino acid transport system substrate-binding protein
MMKKLYFMIFVSGFIPVVSFDNLDQISRFAESVIEFPEPDYENYLHPEYSTYHKHQRAGFFQKAIRSLLEFFGIVSKSDWSINSFHNALIGARKKLETTPLASRNQINVQQSTKCFLWGDLFGAFHSLQRSLVYLNRQGVISDNLILSDDTIFIFNGNVVDGSPFILETFTILLSLIAKNPGKIFYIAGRSEKREVWKEYGLTKELFAKADGRSAVLASYNNEISTFFSLLQTYLVLKGPDRSELLVSGEPDDEIKKQRESPHTKAWIKGINRSISYQKTEGLQQLPSDIDASAWTVFSSPTLSSKRLYDFTSDAFVLISPQESFSEWTLSLFSRKPEDLDFQKRTFNLLTGQPISKGALSSINNSEPLVVGCTLDLSKTSAALGQRLRLGLDLRINKTNRAGGIEGRPLRMIFLDDAYTPRLTLVHVTQLLNRYKTNIMLSPLGTPTVEAFLPLVEEHKLTVVFPCTGAMIFRKPELTSIVHLRTSYAREAEALVDYAFKNIQARKFAIFYQDDSYGKSPLIAARALLKSFQNAHWIETPYARNNPNVDDAASKILSYNPDVILFFSTPAPSANLIRKLGVNKIATTVCMGISFLTDVFRNFLRSKGLELIMARVMPDPVRSDLEIVRNYRRDLEQYNPGTDLSVDSLEGYVNADIFIHIVESLNKPVNSNTLMKAFEQIKNFSYKGLTLNFDSETRELLKDVWIDTGTGPWISAPMIDKSPLTLLKEALDS